MEISHVVRGEDHISNTPRQILLYRALGAQPPAFAHVSMVLGPDGSPLSKRHGASSLSDFRERGILPEAMLNYLVLLGWAHPEGKEILSAGEIASVFSLDRVGHAAAMFDMKKLSWLNAHYLRSATGPRLLSACRAGLVSAGLVPEGDGDAALEDWLGRALQAHAGQMETLTDAATAMRPLLRFAEFLGADPISVTALGGLASQPQALEIVNRFADTIESRDPQLLADREAFRAAAGEVGKTLGVKGRALYHAIRVAITAADTGPELDRLVPLIDEGAWHELPAPMVAIPSCARRARLVAARLTKGPG
jgi:glutamyl/glutaminyl-tRNA synthetase